MSALQQALLGSASSGTGTWDPAKKNATITLSNSNRTATAGAANSYQSVLGTPSLSGTYTFVVTITTVAEGTVGVATGSASLTTFIGASNSVGYYQDGRVFKNGSVIDTISSWATGSTITVNVDVAGLQVRFAANGGAFSSFYSLSGLTAPFYAGAGLFNIGQTAIGVFP